MSTASNVAKKAKPDLTKATVAPPPVEPSAVDTTTPMDTSVLPFTMIYVPKWGPWLLSRLQEHWPHISEFHYKGILANLTNQNGNIFIRSKRAVLLATHSRETLEARPVVKVIFCFKFHPDDEDQNKDVRLLFRRVDEWAKSMGARYVRVETPAAVDLTPTRLKEILGGDEASYFVKDFDK